MVKNYMAGSLVKRICFRTERISTACLAVLLLAPSLVRADEPLFGFTYTTDLLPKGKFEVEQWSTTRFTKATGDFWLQENRTEFEYGVNDRFQLSVYGDYSTNRAVPSAPRRRGSLSRMTCRTPMRTMARRPTLQQMSKPSIGC
jgi:hypothetical protein